MSAPVPESPDAGGAYNPITTPGVQNALSNLNAGPSIGSLLSSIKSGPKANLPDFSSSFYADPNAAKAGQNPFWSAAKNVLDFIETPFYMATNAADVNFEKMDKGEDAQSLGSFLDDLRQGAQRGWEGGINHNPEFTKDWVDVIEHAQKGTSDEGNTGLAKAVGIPLDLLIDPLNAVPSAGIAKGAVKGTLAGVNAIGDALKGEKAVKAGAEAAAKVPEPLAQEAAKGAQTAEKQPFVVDSGGTATLPEEAPKAPTAVTPDQNVQAFQNAPAIQDILQNIGKNPVEAFGSAFGKQFKSDVANSDISKIVQGFRDGFARPIPASPENILQAHLQGAVDKDALAEKPIPTMAQPEEVKLPKEPVETPPTSEVKSATAKQEELTNSAAHNTLASTAWDNMSRSDQFKARNAEALNRNIELGLGHRVGVTFEGKGAGKADLPGYQLQKQANEMANETSKYQLNIDNAELSKEGYRGDKARAQGATPKEAGGITHPFVYNAQAGQLPFARALEYIKKLDTGGIDAENPKLKIDRYSKAGLVTKLVKASESTLFARGMAPVVGLSKYAVKGADFTHLSLGDILEAGMAKGDVGGKSLFTSAQIRDHLIGSSTARMVNPMTMATAGETLLHVRKNIFEAIKKAGGQVSQEKLESMLTQAEKEIHNVLMVKDSAYGKAARTLMPAMRKTRDDAMDAAETQGKMSYEDDMRNLARRIVRDPHLGEMLEQRHLYHAAMHKADIKDFTEHKWDQLKNSLMRFAGTDMNARQAIKWMEQSKKDGKNLLPEMDRADYQNWMDRLESSVIKPSEKQAALADKATAATAKGAEKDSARPVAESFSPEGDFPMTLSDLRVGAIVTDTIRRIHPIKSFFDAKYPFVSSAFYDSMQSGIHSRAKLMNQFHQSLSSFVRKYPNVGKLAEDFAAIQSHAVDKEALSGSAQELHKIIQSMVGSDVPFVRALQNKELSAEYFRNMVRDYLPQHVNQSWMNSAKWEQLGDFWKHTTIKDSLGTADFLSKTAAMAAHIYNDQAIAASYMRNFASTVPKEGYTKIMWNNRGKSTDVIRRKGYSESRRKAEEKPGFYDALDKNLYYEKNAALEIPLVHRLMNESRAVSNDTMLGQFVNNVYDPMTQIMKLFQTTLRPGHWVTNFLGDAIRMHMAGVRVSSIAPAYRVIYALGRDKGMYRDIPSSLDRAAKIANKDYTFGLKNGADSISLGGGRFKNISLVEIGRRLEDSGAFVSPHAMGQHEDFVNRLDTAENAGLIKAVNAVMDRVLNTKLGGTSANDLAALRDNANRIPIAMDELLHNTDAKNLDELFDKASARVRKWAPTSQDFTKEESMYARRAIFYYTWLRGMLPNVAETLMTKPGTFMVPSKAMYAVAKANNVDPISIGDPFPINQMFPSYYYENVIGPQILADGGALWGLNPKAPGVDVLDTVLHGVNSETAKKGPLAIPQAMGENLMGMTNPFVQIPFNLISGQSNGVPIKDPAQYAQDQLLPPQLDLISKYTGKELYNPAQNRTDKGNVSPNVDLANFLTGLQIANYNSPAAERAVVGEQKADRSTIKADAKRNAR